VDQSPFSELAAVDRLIHDPSRLAIVSALLACQEADFQYLLAATALSKGNLSSHLSKLEAAGVVEIRKGFDRKVPWTRARLTSDGRKRVEGHWRDLQRIMNRAKSHR